MPERRPHAPLFLRSDILFGATSHFAIEVIRSVAHFLLQIEISQAIEHICYSIFRTFGADRPTVYPVLILTCMDALAFSSHCRTHASPTKHAKRDALIQRPLIALMQHLASETRFGRSSSER